MKNALLKHKEYICRVMRRIYKKNFVTSLSGTVSLRIDKNLLLITPEKVDRGEMKSHQIATLSTSGENFTPLNIPDHSMPTHKYLYENNSSLNAIVQCNPPFASLFTIENSPYNISHLRQIQPNSHNFILSNDVILSDEFLATLLLDNRIVLNKGGGIISVGNTIAEALDSIEQLENYARLTIFTHYHLAQQHESFNPIHSS